MEKRAPQNRKGGKKPYGRDGHSGKSSPLNYKKESYKKREDTRQDGQTRKDGPKRFDQPRAGDQKGKERYTRSDYTEYQDRGKQDHFRRRDESGFSEENKAYKKDGFKRNYSEGQRPYKKSYDSRGGRSNEDKGAYKPIWKKGEKSSSAKVYHKPGVIFGQDGTIRLNKYIANSGICSRREADLLITAGAVTVNGAVVTTLGTKVKKEDIVIYEGQRLTAESKVYVLLNKPKDFITTSDDPQGRKTVMDLIKGAGDARLFPVGRLDRNTTGLLLLTNDGELTKKLTHPKHRINKLYHVQLDRPFARADMGSLAQGVELDGEKIIPDAIAYVGDGEDKNQVGIEIHSGQNRIVRRMFESLDYKVKSLDRVLFAGLSKRDLPRGKWRFLTEKEVSFLKML